MAVEYLGTGNDDGVNFGKSTDKIGFYGLTAPIVKPSFTAAAITTVLSTTTGHWLFFTSSQPDAIVALVNDIRAQLVALGLVTT